MGKKKRTKRSKAPARGARLVDVVPATHGFATHEHPVFSPDGRWIAYYGGQWPWFQIHVVGIDGLEDRPITCGKGNHTQPAWSPDGRWIYYRAQESGEAPWALWRSSVEDPDLRQRVLADPAVSFKHPSPSPDGRFLAWFSDEGSPESFHLWKAPLLESPDGVRLGNRVRLTSDPDRNDCHPVWSPDGSRLAFHAYMGRVEATVSHVFTCAADGSDVRRVTDVDAMHKHPFFVGSDLLVHHTEVPGGRRCVVLRRADGPLVAELTNGKQNDKHPSPYVPARGSVRIAFASKKRGGKADGEEHSSFDVFWGTLAGVPVRR
jgi:hypothetical protein